MTAHTCKTITPGCYRCDLGKDEYIHNMEDQISEMESEIENLQSTVQFDGLYQEKLIAEIERLKAEILDYQTRVRHVIRAATGVYLRNGVPS